MLCDLCNADIESPARLLGTKAVITSKDCWKHYLEISINDGVIQQEELQELLPGMMARFAISDTPWALCSNCVETLEKTGFPFGPDDELPAHGHALCVSVGQMQFKVIDEEGMRATFRAASEAVGEIMSSKKKRPRGLSGGF